MSILSFKDCKQRKERIVVTLTEILIMFCSGIKYFILSAKLVD